jgi:DNA-directed RNA polymerase specialized sigma24 family protein
MGTQGAAEDQLRELLADPQYMRTVHILTAEVAYRWNRGDAPQVVLSAIGEPDVLAAISAAVRTNKQNLAMLISRRRVINLLRRDATRHGHLPLSQHESDGSQELVDTSPDGDPVTKLQHLDACKRVHLVLARFEVEAPVRTRSRQANLLRRRFLEGASYRDLSVELRRSHAAVRVRILFAKRAFRRFVELNYPDVRKLLVQWGS